jgi:hypothetical protein
MKKRVLCFLAGCIHLIGFGQQKNFDFNNAVPANFTSTANSLTLSSEHTKDGNNSLKWEVRNGTVLTANNLGISQTDISNGIAGAARFFIYSRHISNDTLVFCFFDKDGMVQREGHMLWNYTDF